MVFSIFFIPLFFHPAVCEGLWAWPACSSAMRGGHYYWGSCAVDEPCRTHTVRSNLRRCVFQPGMVVLGLAWTYMGLSRLYHKALGKFSLRLIFLKWHNRCFLGSWLQGPTSSLVPLSGDVLFLGWPLCPACFFRDTLLVISLSLHLSSTNLNCPKGLGFVK